MSDQPPPFLHHRNHPNDPSSDYPPAVYPYSASSTDATPPASFNANPEFPGYATSPPFVPYGAGGFSSSFQSVQMQGTSHLRHFTPLSYAANSNYQYSEPHYPSSFHPIEPLQSEDDLYAEEAPDLPAQQFGPCAPNSGPSNFAPQYEPISQPQPTEHLSSNISGGMCLHPYDVSAPILVGDGQPLPRSLMERLPIRIGRPTVKLPPKLSQSQVDEFEQLLKKQKWFTNNTPEPIRIDPAESFVKHGWCQETDQSRFIGLSRYHSDNRYHCVIPHKDKNGRPCTKSCKEKRDAVAHARSAFNYIPYPCRGACGQEGCTSAFTTEQRFNDHVRNTNKLEKEPKVGCRHCAVPRMLKRNFRRHHQEKCQSALRERCTNFEECMIVASQPPL